MSARDEALREDFRRRALAAAGAVAALGALAAALAARAAPELTLHLTGTASGRSIVLGGAASLAAAVVALLRRRYFGARAAAALSVVLVLVGWGWGLHPWLVTGAVTIEEAAAPPVTLRLVAWILAGGSVVLVPAFAYLYATFHGRVLFPRALRRDG